VAFSTQNGIIRQLWEGMGKKDGRLEFELKSPEFWQKKWSGLRQLAAAILCSAQLMLKKANFMPVFDGCEQKTFALFLPFFGQKSSPNQ